ncbi:MAG: hypothetical protein PHO48_02900 [Candidatus Gracilibacteria bacterium]|jgi:hypothetical protein|nr:hypothetical protein [Candidatus Gracilibacteria bacterium]MDD5179059.1 hypothetical protein [Candidatus Gracilibacteria bacterium]
MPKFKILFAIPCLLLSFAAAQAADLDQVQDIYSRESISGDTTTQTNTNTPEAAIRETTETTPTQSLPTTANTTGKGGVLETTTTTTTTVTTQTTGGKVNPNVPPFNGGVISNPFTESTPVIIAQPILDYLPEANQITSFSYASYLKGGNTGKAKVELSQTGPETTNLAIVIGMLILSFVAYRKNKGYSPFVTCVARNRNSLRGFVTRYPRQ